MTPGWAERAANAAPAVSRRRSRAIEHTTSIIAAARRLITTRTASFTIQELVREARVGLPTFYRHFASKDDLLLAVLGELVADACVQYEQQANTLADPLERLRSYIAGTLATLGDERVAKFGTSEFMRLRQLFPDGMTQVAKPFTDLVLRAIHDAQAAGSIDPADPQRDAEFISDLVIAVYHRYAWSGPEPTPDELADDVCAFILHGLRARTR